LGDGGDQQSFVYLAPRRGTEGGRREIKSHASQGWSSPRKAAATRLDYYVHRVVGPETLRRRPFLRLAQDGDSFRSCPGP
jgi:hypothetical protein